MGNDQRKLFGTDGIRGRANTFPMSTDIAHRVGMAAGHFFKQESDRRHKVLIGKDTRLSCYMLERALEAGLLSMGVDVLEVGPLPTAGVAYITRSLRSDAGIMISASHNPYQDNGIKFFSKSGFKLPDEEEEEIESLVFSDELDTLRPPAEEVGKAFHIHDGIGRYVEFLKNSFPKGMTLSGKKIVVDCSNGAAYKVAPCVLRELDAEVIAIHDSPSGKNINHQCGSQHPDVLAQAVKEHGADVGATFDGDADRALICDSKGKIYDGDVIMGICAAQLSREGRLVRDTLVTTVMTNVGLEVSLAKKGIRMERTQVGDRYVVELMREGGFNLGGEKSGHIIFLDHNTTGDGIISLLQVLAILQTTGQSLSQLSEWIEEFPQVLKNVRVSERIPIDEIPALDRVIREVEKELGAEGKQVIRYSGTEPLLRIMIQGRDPKEIERMADKIARVAQEEVGEKALSSTG